MARKVKLSASGLKIYRRLLNFAFKYWQGFLLGIIGTAIQSGTDAGFTWFLKPILDQGFIAKNLNFIRWLPIIILIAFVVRGVSGFAANYYMNWVGRSLITEFRQRIFSKLLRLPAYYYDNTSSGQILSTLLYNVEQIAKASTDALIIIVREVLFISGLLIVMFTTSWRLTLVFLVIAPLVMITSRKSGRRMRLLSTNLQQSMGTVTHIAEEAIEGYKVVRTFGGEAYEIEKFNRATVNNQKREMKVTATNSWSTALIQQIAGCAIAGIIYFATLHGTEQLTAGGFVSILAAMLAILKPLRNINSMSSIIQKGIAGADSIFTLLDKPQELDQGQITLQRAKGLIEYQHVSFQYPNTERNILSNISFTALPGQVIALVGHSGAGKTSLVNLLPRFYDDYTGTISIDGIDIRDLRLHDLRNQFALVSQQVTLFNDTVANNIAYGRSDVSRTDIIAAAEAAHVMEFIKLLPEGLDSLIGENGVLLSGGQRQRIALARAILKNAPILILDEATSALDTKSERVIQAALVELMQHRTTLVIAHRLSTVENADQILVLHQGQIIERGTHLELLKAQGHYAKLYQLQFKD